MPKQKNSTCFQQVKMERGAAVISLFLFTWAIKSATANFNDKNSVEESYSEGDAKVLLSSTKSPQGICNLSNLRYLFLDNNNFTGTIPEGIANLRNLEYLSLGKNKLTGKIPQGIGNLNSLVYLSLEGNNLSGTVPPLMSNCSLTSLKLSDNSFTGPLPPSLSRCTQLRISDFRRNNFKGDIPPLINFHDLRVLSLSYNKLRGNIPAWITNLTKLQVLDLSNNQFSGKIPSNLEKLTGFGRRGDPQLGPGETLQEEITIVMKGNVLQANTILDLSNNHLTGSIPATIGNLSHLSWLNLSRNRLEGMIPPSLGQICNSLVFLSLEGNNLSGTVPPLMSNCSLKSLKLSDNSFTGPLPPSLSSCTQLQITDFRNNRFTGEIPSLANFQELRVLSLSHNELRGSIPAWITNLTKLQMLDLSNNQFSGTIPSNLANLTGFGKFGDPRFNGQTLQEEITIVMKGNEYHLYYVLQANTIFDLSNNHLTGHIPATIASLSHLRLLNLSRNRLEGSIPPSLGQISNLEQLDLCHNLLTGRIPEDLSKLSMLASLDVSSNRLCGPIPSGTQFDTFSKTSFQSNKCLCGRQIEKSCKLTPPTASVMEEKESFWSVVDEHISVIALTLGFSIGFAGALYLIMGWDIICRLLVDLKSKSFYGASHSENGSWSFKVSLFKPSTSST